MKTVTLLTILTAFAAIGFGQQALTKDQVKACRNRLTNVGMPQCAGIKPNNTRLSVINDLCDKWANIPYAGDKPSFCQILIPAAKQNMMVRIIVKLYSIIRRR